MERKRKKGMKEWRRRGVNIEVGKEEVKRKMKAERRKG